MKKLKIIDKWISIYISKIYPFQVKNYRDWRDFLDFWLERSDLDYNEAVNIYAKTIQTSTRIIGS